MITLTVIILSGFHCLHRSIELSLVHYFLNYTTTSKGLCVRCGEEGEFQKTATKIEVKKICSFCWGIFFEVGGGGIFVES